MRNIIQRSIVFRPKYPKEINAVFHILIPKVEYNKKPPKSNLNTPETKDIKTLATGISLHIKTVLFPYLFEYSNIFFVYFLVFADFLLNQSKIGVPKQYPIM